MRVLLLPVNIASDISHKVRSLRNIGVEARGFSIAESAIQTSDEVKFFYLDYSEGKAARIRRMKVFAQMWSLIAWADVLHWIADANVFAEKWNYKFLRWINKPGVVQWMGSDIRVPQIDFPANPFYGRAFEEDYEYSTESADVSRANQQFASALGFYPLEFIGLEQFIDRKLFPKRFRTWQSIVLSEHVPHFPATVKTRPLVLHSPSAPVAKGTKYVLRAVENLKSRYDFDFKLIQNMERREALKIMSECDVYIDQLILGAHGYAAVEAMAFGKPVVCYINPLTGKNYPADLPIVNANPDNIEEKLENLIQDAGFRNEIGRKSRAYVEKYHDEQKIARELLKIYQEVIELSQKRRERK